MAQAHSLIKISCAGLLLGLALIPLALEVVAGPLVPPSLALTPTANKEIRDLYQQQTQVANLQQASVIETPIPTAPFPLTQIPPGLLIYESNRNSNWDIYLLDSSTSEEKRLTDDPAEDRSPSWSPDGTRIAFASNRDGDFEIYLMTVADGSRVRLTNNTADDESPVWSPNGEYLAYTSDDVTDTNPEGDRELMMLPVSHPIEITQLTHDQEQQHDPIWSPMGERIAYFIQSGHITDVGMVRLGDQTVFRLTDEAADDRYPSWSQDGSSIAFASNRLGNWDIFVLWPETGELKQIIGDGSEDWGPIWSPKPNILFFISDRDGDPEVYLMDVKGNRLQQITNNRYFDDQADWFSSP